MVIFQNKAEAQKMEHELKVHGYPAQSLNFEGNQSSTESLTIGDVFCSFTGKVDTAKVMLSITVPDGQDDRVAHLLESFGAMNVNKLQAGMPAAPQSGFSAETEAEFHKHFEMNYAATGKSYESYAHAYHYGHSLANDPRYLSSNWNWTEASTKPKWAAAGHGKWEDYKGAVQQGWDKVRDPAFNEPKN